MADPGQDFLQGYFGQLQHAQQKQQNQQQAQEFMQTLQLHQQTAQQTALNQRNEENYRQAMLAYQGREEARQAQSDQLNRAQLMTNLIGGGAERVPVPGQGTPTPGVIGVNQQDLDPNVVDFGQGNRFKIPTPDEKLATSQAAVKANYQNSVNQGMSALNRLKANGHINDETASKLETMIQFDPSSIKGSDVIGAFKTDKPPAPEKMSPGQLYVDTIINPGKYGAQGGTPSQGPTQPAEPTNYVETPEEHPVIKALDKGLHKAISKDPNGFLKHPTDLPDSATVRAMALKGIQASASVAPAAAQAERSTEDKDFSDMTQSMREQLKDVKTAKASDVLPAYFNSIDKLTASRGGKPLSSTATIKALKSIRDELPPNEQKANILNMIIGDVTKK